MSIIQLNLPSQVTVHGALRDRANPWELDRDMLAIELPGKIFITVGWHPDIDPSGEYRVAVFRGSSDNELDKEYCSRNVSRVQAEIYRRVTEFLEPQDNSTIISLSLNGRICPPPTQIEARGDITSFFEATA